MINDSVLLVLGGAVSFWWLVTICAFAWLTRLHEHERRQQNQDHSAQIVYLARTLALFNKAQTASEAVSAGVFMEPPSSEPFEDIMEDSAPTVRGVHLEGGGVIDFMRTPGDATFNGADPSVLITEEFDDADSGSHE